ncbi:MAG: Gfo/Idh/MocA family oxidoreductase [Pseudomonadota bacterium]
MTRSIGIVGAGDIVRKLHLPVLQCLDDVRIAWLYDAAPLRARAVGDAYGVRVTEAEGPRELPACDVVLLAVPAPARGAYLQEFARRETAVFCEKPFALSLEEHRNYLEWFAPHRLGCGYMRRFYRSTRIVDHLLKQGWLGDLRAIRIAEGARSRGSGSGHSFLDDPRFAAAGGVLMDLGTHTLDLALQFAGDGDSRVEHAEITFDGKVDRHAQASARIGATSTQLDYAVSWLAPQSNRLQLDFAHASVWMGIAPDACVFLGDAARPREALELGASVEGATTMNQAFALEWREFLAGLDSGSESRVSARSALATTGLAQMIRDTGIRAHE